jgi:hypothetical protein
METPEIAVPNNFRSVISDFTKDLSITFPEYSYLWAKWALAETSNEEIRNLFDYCLTVYPERFFDILYQTTEIFDTESAVNTNFLPNVDFKLLFHCENVSESTKKTIWKYLQLILFTIVGGIKDKSTFGDSMRLFDGVDENDLHEKLNETMSGLADFFKNISTENEDNTDSPSSGEEQNTEEHFRNMFDQGMFGNTPFGNMPDGESLHTHLKSLFNGKIGALAKEMAEEISEEFKDILGEDTSDIKSTGDVVKKLMKDPKKIMGMMKSVGNKLDDKLKNGDISREEIMKEAGDMFSKMNEMGDKNAMADMLKNMAKTMGMGKNVRVNMDALNKMTKMSSMRDRMRANLEKKKQHQLEEIEKLKQRKQAEAAKFSLSANSENSFVFRLDGEEAQEKSMKSQADLMAELLIEEESKKAPVVSSSKKSKKSKK